MAVTAIDTANGAILGYYPDAGFVLVDSTIVTRAQGDVLVVNGHVGEAEANTLWLNHRRDMLAEFPEPAPDEHLDMEYESRFEIEDY